MDFNLDINAVWQYIMRNRTELLRLYRGRVACFVQDADGSVHVDACYDHFMDGFADAKQRLGACNFVLHHIVPLSEEPIVRIPDYL